ncbi:MAG: hypothetical protein OdinLCB4_000045 [Candidatus Odinarchaeum yellowstonii]|uniref:Uncharacterized protein n=1 Tax=Odinarchaeota yellowstonii (strain LCB_4) TaxID=1841599 RepID=A0AAF0IBG5_ODILC|nr:MAG: hypothetical protein OdinLCB4_000045 [Candidatus Odinarchaeum yellowstonii]
MIFTLIVAWILWIIFINLISGWSLLLIFYKNPRNELNELEIFSYSFSFGASYLAILGFILDWTIGVTFVHVLIPTIIIILAALIIRRKYLLDQIKFQSIFKNKSFILIILVLAFGLIIRGAVPLVNEILMAWDPWYWLNVAKNIVYHGHSLISFKPLYPSGYAYISGISCLVSLELTYLYIQLISVIVYFSVGATTIISLAYRVLDENKVYSLFAGLVFSASYFLASYGMLGLPQNVAFAIIPAALFVTSKRGLKRLPGLFLLAGVYVIHSPSAMIILITLSVYGLYYLLTHREAIHYIETKIIIILLLLLASITPIIVGLFFPFIIDYFLKFTYTSSIKPQPVIYLFYSAGIITYSLAFLGGVYALRNEVTLLKMFFILLIVSTVFTFLPASVLGIPWPPIRYIMYMSIASSVLACFGMKKTVELIKKFDKKNNFSKYIIPFFMIGTIMFQSSIGLTALIGKGYWDFAINKDEYQTLIWLNNQSNYSESVIVYPSIILPSKALLNPRFVGTNATHVFNETVVNATIISELLTSRYNYLIVDVGNYPILSSLIDANPSFTLVHEISNIRVYQF